MPCPDPLYWASTLTPPALLAAKLLTPALLPRLASKLRGASLPGEAWAVAPPHPHAPQVASSQWLTHEEYKSQTRPLARLSKLAVPFVAQVFTLGISLEGKMLKLKLQYFGHLMRRVDSLEKTLLLGGIGGRRRRG